MTEENYRKWDVVIKWLGVIGVLLGGGWTIYTYHNQQKELQAQQRAAHEADASARRKELNSFVFQQQTTLYLDAARAASTLATALDPQSDLPTSITHQKLEEERQRFEQLYWGDLVVVEDRRVEIAMVTFRECLIKNGKNCKRGNENQNGQPISKAVSIKLDDPGLLNFSLELSACIRSALQEDREIQFGAKKDALTICPYD